MGELRLICPGCGAEYRLDDRLIPAQGREVECSACGRVWHQPGADATRPAQPVSPLPAIPPTEQRRDPIDFVLSRSHPDRDQTIPPLRQETAPRLNRPLPANVLSILTEEAERERIARAAEKPDAAASPIPDWPAMTVTEPIPAQAIPIEPPQQDATAATRPQPPTSEAIPTPIETGAETIAPSMPALQTAPDIKQEPPASTVRAGSLGFVLGLLIAALALTLYLAAPLVPEDTAAGQALAHWRATADQVRHWLANLF